MRFIIEMVICGIVFMIGYKTGYRQSSLNCWFRKEHNEIKGGGKDE